MNDTPWKRRRSNAAESGTRALPAVATCALAHARRAAAASTARHSHRGAAWYAEKAVSISGLPEDALLLAESYLRCSEPSRALRALESRGLLEVSAWLRVSDDNADANAGAGARAGVGVGAGAPQRSAVRSEALPYFYVGALAHKAMGAASAALTLLESVMEGRGRAGLRTPLTPVTNVQLSAEARARAALVGDAYSGASGPAGGALSPLAMAYTSASEDEGGREVWRTVLSMALEHAGVVLAAQAAAFPLFAEFEGGAGWVPLGDGSSINIVSSLASLRGDILLQADNRLRATQWYLAALRIDPHNASAHMALADHHLLSEEEDSKLLAYLDSALRAGPDAELGAGTLVDVVTVEQGPSAHGASAANCDPQPSETGETRAPLVVSAQYATVRFGWLRELIALRLGRSSLARGLRARLAFLESSELAGVGLVSTDILAARAEVHAAQHDAAGALAASRAALDADPSHPLAALVFFSSLCTLRRADELFTAAHAAVAAAPRAAASWFGVGCYYIVLGRLSTAARHFARATQLDPCLGDAWMGLGVCFAGADEAEPALAAFRTAARLLPQAHGPPLAMAAAATRAGQFSLARAYLDAAFLRCPHDPLVYHEAGVLDYRQGSVSQAWGHWTLAVQAIEGLAPALRRPFEPTFFNLGHACRRLGRYAEALAAYGTARALAPEKPSTLAAIGLTHQLAESHGAAATAYHAALALAPEDPFASRMLRIALQDMLESSGGGPLVRESKLANALSTHEHGVQRSAEDDVDDGAHMFTESWRSAARTTLAFDATGAISVIPSDTTHMQVGYDIDDAEDNDDESGEDSGDGAIDDDIGDDDGELAEAEADAELDILQDDEEEGGDSDGFVAGLNDEIEGDAAGDVDEFAIAADDDAVDGSGANDDIEEGAGEWEHGEALDESLAAFAAMQSPAAGGLDWGAEGADDADGGPRMGDDDLSRLLDESEMDVDDGGADGGVARDPTARDAELAERLQLQFDELAREED